MTSNSDSTGKFSKMPQAELEELLKRLKDVSSNAKILEGLSDRGKRVREKMVAAEIEIKRRAAIEEASLQFEQMSIQDSAENQSSGLHSNENEFPKFCAKLEDYERNRHVKSKFKPFRPMNRLLDGRDVTPESCPILRQDPPTKEISTLSMNDSLRIAAIRQTVMKNLYREDSATFREFPENKISLSMDSRLAGLLEYRVHQEDSDSDADGIQERLLSGLEELD